MGSSKRRQDFLNNCTPVACRASAVCTIVPSRLDRSQDAFGTSLMVSSSLRVEHGKPIIERKKRFLRIKCVIGVVEGGTDEAKHGLNCPNGGLGEGCSHMGDDNCAQYDLLRKMTTAFLRFRLEN